ncbi:MAG: DUF2207 family protein, partial [Actinomycetota bacterium]
MRRMLVTLALVGLALLPAAPARAQKSFSLPEASVDIKVTKSGAVKVTEHLTYSFFGSFSGGYREIPVRAGESIDSISVSEAGRGYRPGASAELGSSGAPDTFGVADLGDATRIVWHYEAFGETRTFDVGYTIRGLAEAYEDVVDVNLQVWGDEWGVELSRLRADITIPGDGTKEDVFVWGHPATVDGFTELKEDGSGATLTAANIAPGRWVEMRTVFPVDRIDPAPADARVRDGLGLPGILEKEGADIAAAERDRSRMRFVRQGLPWLIPLAILLALIPAGIVSFFIWRRHGREPTVPPVPEHIHEPPGDVPPAMVTALLDSGYSKASGDAFTATLFDLIRRGHIEAFSTTTVRKTWAGLKQEELSDLSVRMLDKPEERLTPFEKEVRDALTHAMDGKERLLLSDLEKEIAEDQEYYAGTFSDFRKKVGNAVRERRWWINEGLKPAIIAMLVAWAGVAGGIVGLATTYDELDPFPWETIAWGSVVGIAVVNAIVLLGFVLVRKGIEKRTQEAAEEASRWASFRRFLNDFAGIPEATPGSIEIWERYLVYGIAFGIADRVLAAAQLHAPPELDTTSSVFWISHGGSLGSGRTAFAIGSISSAVASASVPST